jgi:hypothetical protein
MNNEDTLRSLSALSAIIAALLILVSIVVLSMAVDFNPDFLSDPAELISAGLDASAAELFRWGSILELLGYFMLLIPLTLYLWYWLKPRSPRLITLTTIFGLISIVIGMIGAAIRASYFPSMMVAYPQAAEAQRQVLQVVFGSVTAFTFEGLYALDSILVGLWWLGIGLILRAERRVLGIVTTIMGIAVLGAGIGWLFQVDALARLEVIYFFEPVWLIWLGIVILREVKQSEPVTEHVMAT